MKYLKNHVMLEVSVIDMLNKVLLDIGDDRKVCDVQVPEIRSTLTHPRSLADPLIFEGHTGSFDNHTIHWRLMHGTELTLKQINVIFQNFPIPQLFVSKVWDLWRLSGSSFAETLLIR